MIHIIMDIMERLEIYKLIYFKYYILSLIYLFLVISIVYKMSIIIFKGVIYGQVF